MAASRGLLAASLVLLMFAATFLTIAFSSSAWMKYEDSSKERGQMTRRVGLWESCHCIAIRNLFASESEEYDYDSEIDEDSEEMPGWYIAADALSVFSLIALMLSLGSTLLSLCLNRTLALTLQIVACSCTAVLLLITISVFGDQFTKTQLDAFIYSDSWLVGVDWGLGLAILALVLTVISIIANGLDLRRGEPAGSRRPEGVTMQTTQVTHVIHRDAY